MYRPRAGERSGDGQRVDERGHAVNMKRRRIATIPAAGKSCAAGDPKPAEAVPYREIVSLIARGRGRISRPLRREGKGRPPTAPRASRRGSDRTASSCRSCGSSVAEPKVGQMTGSPVASGGGLGTPSRYCWIRRRSGSSFGVSAGRLAAARREPREERPCDLGEVVDLVARGSRREKRVQQVDASVSGGAGHEATASGVGRLQVKERVEDECRKRLERSRSRP